MLVDTHQLVIDGWLAFACARGRQLTEDEIVERLFGRRTLDILVDEFGLDQREAAALVASGVDDKSAEIERIGGLRAVPGAPRFALAALAAGMPCAVVSSASTANIERALQQVGLAGRFSVIVDHDRVDRGKPSPDPYLAAAAELGIEPEVCVVFEDTAPGIAAAHAAGARCVGIASHGRPSLVARADLIVADFRGLTPSSLLKRLDGRAPRAGAPGARCRGRSMVDGSAERRR